ncbi:MAG: zf-HC2 domain-containing protein [Acidobacteria bacterium]|nr:zf-HC2 domain-containing protein [Acidobacteriota bacterium]MBV9475038.1 zf-HC2 domain-containing protein [Acidobacteriota bacterium]
MNAPTKFPTCHDVLTFLDDYVAGELAPDTRATFDRHLSVCPSCVAYLASYRETIAMARAAHRPPTLPTVPPELLAAIRTSIAPGK